MKTHLKPSFHFLLVMACLIVFRLPATAQIAGKQQLHGHLPAAVARQPAAGLLTRGTNLQLAVGLPVRNQEGLTALLRQIYDPASTNYHHYLTPQQFAEQFGPTEPDYQTLIAFAQAHGLRVTARHPNRLLLDVSGPVENIERALHVTIRTYRHPTENRTFFAPDTEPSLDLTVPILHISGLDNYSLPRPHLTATQLVNGQNALPNAGSGPSGTYLGKDFRAAYVPDSARDGSGQVVGLLQFDGYTASDITYYESLAGLPNVPLQNVLIDGASGNPSHTGGEVEVSLDIEMAISMATNLSKVVVYMAPNPSPFVDILNRMANDNVAKQLSCSWYVPNGAAEPAADLIFQQMAAQGQSFFNASGDNDAYTGLISFPGDTPYITQVGGTTLTTSGAGGTWVSEKVWNWGNGIGSGGGISTQYPIPSWQTNISMTTNQGSVTQRNTPDVALTADNVYVRADGSDYNVGGTSCAAPLWAGFAALVNQQAAASGQPPLGFINPAIDVIGSGVNYAPTFHDITTGNNESSGSPTKFSAVGGYDLCTGWGTPAGQNLINALANPEALLLTPPSGFTSLGGVGGPFTVPSQSFSLTNAGTNVLTWTLGNTSLWLNASPGGGTLTPGGPAAVVTVSLNSTASNLLVGTYNATVWFTNLNDSVGQSRQFALSVISPPVITVQPADQAVLDGATATFVVGVTGGSPLSFQWQDNGTTLTDGGDLSGSTTTNLTVSNVSATNVGTYTVMATNFAGVAVSSNALLTIIPSPPVITMQPSNQTAVVGDTATFSVTAIGTPPYFYQWYFDGANILDATNAILSFANVQLAQTGTYSVVVTNIYGFITSSNVMLTVLVAPPCDPAPTGLVSWWPAEGNASDVAGTNNGVLTGGLGFAFGKVGQAFFFNDTNGYVKIPASSSLNVGAGNGFTLETWINPSDISQLHPLFEWNAGDGVTQWGVHFYISVGGVGALYANVVDSGGNWHRLNSAAAIVTNGVFQHVALTYNKTAGVGTIYRNGVVVVQQTLGSFTPQTSYNLYLGRRQGPDTIYTFAGLLDEPSVYNRALSSNEIAAIYNAGRGGKCPPTLFPVIIVQPTNQTVNVANSVNFSVLATGVSPLSYLWNFNGTNIAGATNATFVLPRAQFADAGVYSAVVTNTFGSAVSSNATLTVVGVPPSIILQPSNQMAAVGANTTFSVAATGSPPLNFQWSFNGTNISGATNTSLTLANVQFSQAGNYAVMVTNAFGSLASSNAVLAVGLAPSILTQPVSMTNIVGTAAAFSVAAAGSSPLSCQWLKNGTSIAGSTSTNLIIINVQTNDAATYSVVLTNFFGSISSSNAILTVLAPPVIVVQPLSQIVTVSNSVAFAVAAGGTPPLNYQWSFNGTNILGATNSLLSLSNVQYSQAGAYAVVVTNLYGLTTSSNAMLTVNPPPPCDPAPTGLVSWWPAEGNASDVAGTNNGVLTGGLGFAFGKVGQAFFFNDTNGYVKIPASSSLNVGAGNGFTLETWINPSDISQLHPLFEWNAGNGVTQWGVHFYISVGGVGALYANVVDSGGTWHSFNSAAAIVTNGVFQHVALTYNKTSGVGTIYRNGVVVAQQTLGSFTPQTSYNLYFGRRQGPETIYTFAGLLDEPSAYNRALSSNDIAAIYNAGNNGKCPLPPVIIIQPTNQAVLAGTTAAFNVRASGTQPLTYQWVFNGTNIIGATNASLTLANVQPAQSGTYLVQAANVAGMTTSSNAVLTVNMPPGIVAQPASCTSIVGAPAAFTVVVMGSAPLTFQWKKNGANITGATSTNLNFVAVQTNDAATYSVGITNAYGSITSSNAVLTVLVPPIITLQPASCTNLAGTAAIFTCTATGTLPLHYQWQKNGSGMTDGGNISGSTATILTLASVSDADAASYTVVVTNFAGSITSSPAALVLLDPPTILSQPIDLTVVRGSNVDFNVTAGGTAPLIYQWIYNGTNFSPATNTWLALTNVQLNQSGNYAVLVTNAYGSIMSSNAVLTVNPLFHFIWNQIPSLRFANTPFAVVVQAQNLNDGIATNFTDTVELVSTNGIPIIPAISANFIQGVWTGAVTVAQTATNLVLQARDNFGESGLANPISVINLPSLTTIPAGSTLYILWPVNPSGFILEATPTLSPANWTHVAAPPIQVGNQYLEPINFSGTNGFYRLRFSDP